MPTPRSALLNAQVRDLEALLIEPRPTHMAMLTNDIPMAADHALRAQNRQRLIELLNMARREAVAEKK